MKAYINRDTLINLIKEHTVFTKAEDIPEKFQWFQIDNGYLSWDFIVHDKFLVDVEPAPEWINNLNKCGDCKHLWTKNCPFRIRDNNDKKPTDNICDSFTQETRPFYWKDDHKIYETMTRTEAYLEGYLEGFK